ncbi:GCN5 family acetyltransferase [Clostridium sulfidigenes]|uniref:GCN5 family acetyltransferase n=1 Tax=Clostridium sulfidigenes TaxID=318464 RepID=A0A084JH96_9CLOT|nr:GNAT family protein [Clostridium sulfidigenes]KEZ88330.1 GCN5 family acetyltransferase [Clostridium sulfidigenes]HAR85967.1 N-acetyltransferase [Clostridium sp.]
MIEGKSVVIRQLELGDEEYLYKWWNDGSFMSHAALAYGTLESKTAIRNSIEKEVLNSQLYAASKRFIICKKEDMTPIGEMSYCGWDKREQKCEFGIKIWKEEQGKGYGKDALSHFIDFMFRFLNLNKIELTSMIDNKRAHSLYRALGFKEIGIVREGFFDSRTGKFSDVMYMDLLKREWIDIREEVL